MSQAKRSVPFIFTRIRDSVPETWDVTCRLTCRLTCRGIGWVRKSVEQTAAYEAMRPQDVAFASPFASKSEAARWMRDSKTGPIREGDRV